MKCECLNTGDGWTTIACCNECGLPLKTEPWEFIGAEFIERVFSEYEYEDEHLTITQHLENVKSLLIGKSAESVKWSYISIKNQLRRRRRRRIYSKIMRIE